MSDFITFRIKSSNVGPASFTLARKCIDGLSTYDDGSAWLMLSDGLNHGAPLNLHPDDVVRMRLWLEQDGNAIEP